MSPSVHFRGLFAVGTNPGHWQFSRKADFDAYPCAILDRGDSILSLVLPFHSQFGHVGRPEFVALTEISHLWRRIYHETGGETSLMRLVPVPAISVEIEMFCVPTGPCQCW